MFTLREKKDENATHHDKNSCKRVTKRESGNYREENISNLSQCGKKPQQS